MWGFYDIYISKSKGLDAKQVYSFIQTLIVSDFVFTKVKLNKYKESMCPQNSGICYLYL